MKPLSTKHNLVKKGTQKSIWEDPSIYILLISLISLDIISHGEKTSYLKII